MSGWGGLQLTANAPSKIIFIRHGEKPPNAGGPPFGFDIDGNADKHSLVARGWSRAGALVGYFAKPTAPIEKPTHVYAATPDAAHNSLHGQRPSQTVAPLCDYLGMSADLTYAVGDEPELAAKIVTRAGVVLVSWEHHAISKIVSAICGPSFTDDWPDRFDLVWILTRSASGFDFSTANQHLLAGDA